MTPRAEALRKAGANVQIVGKDGRVDLAALMKMLAVREVNEILVEAGRRSRARCWRRGSWTSWCCIRRRACSAMPGAVCSGWRI